MNIPLTPLNRALIADCFAELGQRIAAAPDGHWHDFGSAPWLLAGIVENWAIQDRTSDGEEEVCGVCQSPTYGHERGCPVLALHDLMARL